ncbi:hypothetical protein B0H10DRAFT_1969706 [Mycena sp. CBHHK59/15]|nr:hypothetical protein B0H10DRAFT_1969706 [Mycena sp. CBHHK59/15]
MQENSVIVHPDTSILRADTLHEENHGSRMGPAAQMASIDLIRRKDDSEEGVLFGKSVNRARLESVNERDKEELEDLAILHNDTSILRVEALPKRAVDLENAMLMKVMESATHFKEGNAAGSIAPSPVVAWQFGIRNVVPRLEVAWARGLTETGLAASPTRPPEPLFAASRMIL